MSEQLAARAAVLWPLTVRSIVLAAHRENAVYRLDCDEGAFALRLHRIGYRTAAELDSELQLMAMLEGHGVSVPKPLGGRDHSFLQTVDGVHVSVLQWMRGKPLGQTGVPLMLDDRRGTFLKVGELIACMHDAFDAWQRPSGFVRQTWESDGLLGENPQWGRFWDNPMLDEKQRQVMLAVREKLKQTLAARNLDQGLIHADMVSENILVDEGDIAVIDFDDSGFGFRLQDLATALVKHREEPDYDQLRSALLQGYAARKSVDFADVDLFLLVRHLTYLGWIVPRMANAGGAERSAAFIAKAVPMAERFLAQSG